MEAGDYYAVWCAERKCSHGHCPDGHEHPQPFGVVLRGEFAVRLICGYCWHKLGTVTEMVPCDDTVC